MNSNAGTLSALAVYKAVSTFILAAVISTADVSSRPRIFTLEQVMSSPFPSELTAAPKGGAIAWVFNARGLRNIWVAEPPDYRARQITSYQEDDGQDVGQLGWTPDGRSLVYTRGGDFETHRPEPNPRSLAEGTEQDIWIVSVSGREPHKLGQGNSPAVSPKGDSIAFLNKDQIWLVRLGPGAKPAQLVHSKGSATDFKWAPDGSRLAFVSSREDHGFIGVYELGAKSVRYINPGVDRDVEPAWSPDSRRIAFIRTPFSRLWSSMHKKWIAAGAGVAGIVLAMLWRR